MLLCFIIYAAGYVVGWLVIYDVVFIYYAAGLVIYAAVSCCFHYILLIPCMLFFVDELKSK